MPGRAAGRVVGRVMVLPGRVMVLPGRVVVPGRVYDPVVPGFGVVGRTVVPGLEVLGRTGVVGRVLFPGRKVGCAEIPPGLTGLFPDCTPLGRGRIVPGC